MLLLNKYIFQTIPLIQVQLPCIVIVLKVIKVIFEFRGQWISPQQSGQWLRRDGRESRICVYIYIIQAGQEQPLKRQGRHRERGGGLWNDQVKVNIKAAAQTVQQRKFGKRPSHFLTTDDQTCKPEAHMVRQNEMTWFET